MSLLQQLVPVELHRKGISLVQLVADHPGLGVRPACVLLARQLTTLIIAEGQLNSVNLDLVHVGSVRRPASTDHIALKFGSAVGDQVFFGHRYCSSALQ